MTTLQDDIDRIDNDHYHKPEYWKRIVEAARRYANPNIEAACERAANMDLMIESHEMRRIVAAALTRGGDTE